ncbi:hypothetical protein ACFSKL_08740 [Belliella marina]|uniref:PorZ N-terminal beta-propeller domain-containing protein n=1 Tax=Belliella marina TaxID=1644146 RepID=A0ABW4VL78_9BACT
MSWKNKSQWFAAIFNCRLSLPFFQRSISLLFLFFLNPLLITAQSNIPIGTWKTHLSYTDPAILRGSDQTIFHIGMESLFYFSLNGEEINTLTKIDGLYTHQFVAATFDPASKKLLLAYPDGTIDLVGERKISSLGDLKNNSQITEKQVRSIKIIGQKAFLAADFGLGVININLGRFVDSYINIGPNGSKLQINDISADNEYYYLASELGILIGKKTSNLKDFRNWNMTNSNISGGFLRIESIDGVQIALGADSNIYLLDNHGAQPIIGTFGSEHLKIFPNGLYVKKSSSILKIESNGSFQEIFNSPNTFSDFHLIGDEIYLSIPRKGLVRENDYREFKPNGTATKVRKFEITTSGIYALPIFKPANAALYRSFGTASSQLENGNWLKNNAPSLPTSKANLGNKEYIGTQENGLWVQQGDDMSQIQLPGLPLNQSIAVIQSDPLGQIWIGMEDSQSRLYKINPDESINTIPVAGLAFPLQIESDLIGNLWILQTNQTNSFTQLRVFNENTGLNRVISSANNQGGIPNLPIQSIHIDSENRLWIAQNGGIVYIPNISSINNSTAINAVQPLFNNAPLLNGEFVTAVNIAPDQSIWLGTNGSGLWHFSEMGEKLKANYRASNSPMYSDNILNLSYDYGAGELFVVTPEGGLSYRTGSISSSEDLAALKIFPNPIRPDFNGYLSVEGLTDYAQVKITNSAGRLIHTRQVRGGSFTWNIQDVGGKRPPPGIYLVFVVDEMGQERIAGKFVII